MYKRPIKGCMALAAFVFFAIMPAMAVASPELGETSGGEFTRLAPVSKFLGTNVGVIRFTGSVNTECDHASITGEVHVNNGTEITGNITAASFNGTGASTDCTGNGESMKVTPSVSGSTNTLPWCIKAGGGLAADTFTMRGNSCTNASRPITVAWDFTGIGLTCKYVRESAFSGTFTTDSAGQDAVLTISEQEMKNTGEANNIFCPTSWKLDVSFTLETDEASATPLYIR